MSTPIKDRTDETLCSDARNGVREAADELIRRYTRMVSASARPYYLAGADFEDVIQEGMLGLLKAVREYDPAVGASFSSFAETCVKYNIYSAIRSASRKKHMPLNDYVSLAQTDSPEPGALSSERTDPEVLVLDKEAKAELEKALDGMLSAFESKVLDYYFQGYSCKEIASFVNKPWKSVDNAITRIRRKLSAHNIFSGDSR